MTSSAKEIQAWIVDRISALADIAPEQVDVRAPWTRHGLDSVATVSLAVDLEKWLGYRFRENPLEAHPTIETLAEFLADEVKRAGENA